MSESREQREQRLQDIRNSADTLREHLLRLNNAYSESYEHIRCVRGQGESDVARGLPGC